MSKYNKYVMVCSYSFESAMKEAVALLQELEELGVIPEGFWHNNAFPYIQFKNVDVRWLDRRKPVYGSGYRCDEAFGFSFAAREYLTHRKEDHFNGSLKDYILKCEGFEG